MWALLDALVDNRKDLAQVQISGPLLAYVAEHQVCLLESLWQSLLPQTKEVLRDGVPTSVFDLLRLKELRELHGEIHGIYLRVYELDNHSIAIFVDKSEDVLGSQIAHNRELDRPQAITTTSITRLQ